MAEVTIHKIIESKEKEGTLKVLKEYLDLDFAQAQSLLTDIKNNKPKTVQISFTKRQEFINILLQKGLLAN